MIDPERLLAWPFPAVEQSYSPEDIMLYGLAIGLGADPTDERQLRFVNDVRPGTPTAFPTMAVVLGYPGPWMADPATGIDYRRIVHGEEVVWIHRPLPAGGTVIARHKVIEVTDKGAGRGAVITYDKELFEKGSGDLLATVRHTTFARGDGGFSGHAVAPAAREAKPEVSPGEPDRRRKVRTLPQQALLYRLCADGNPLHSDPATARSAGFASPILHGLCTFAMAGHAVIAEWGDYEASRLRVLRARFSAPVTPGETLQFDMWRDEGGVSFQAYTKEGGTLVLSHGRAELDPT